MISDDALLTKLKIPAGYSEIIKILKTNLVNSNHHSIVANYSTAKQAMKLFENPSIISDDRLQSDKFLITQTMMYSQSQYFGETAKMAPIDIKPLLYHYAENSLFGFFVYSLNSYPNPNASGHGLNIKWDADIGKIKVQIKNSGFFQRIIDCYSICKSKTQFAALEYDSTTNDFKETNLKHSFKNEPILTLDEIISLRENLGDQQDGYLYDLIDFVLLFLASSLSRYRPYLWNEISRGEKGTHYIWFQQCFERFDLLKFRLLKSIIDIYKTGSVKGCQLHRIDVVTRQEME